METPPRIRLSLEEVEALANDIFVASGADARNAAALAHLIAITERDGPASHGLFMLPKYVDSLTSAWSNGCANPELSRISASALRLNGDNGFLQVGIKSAINALCDMADEMGIAVLVARNIHHIGALRFDVEPVARRGLIGMAFLNSRPWIVPHGGHTPVFGTNPFAFACPRTGQEPLVVDMASSVTAVTDIRLAVENNRMLDVPAGLNASGMPTTDPKEILETGALLGFGRHKGTAVALIVEILSAALAGTNPSSDTTDMKKHGASTIRPGYTMIALSPNKLEAASFGTQVAQVAQSILDGGGDRIPGDGRLLRRAKAEREGITIDNALHEQLLSFRKS